MRPWELRVVADIEKAAEGKEEFCDQLVGVPEAIKDWTWAGFMQFAFEESFDRHRPKCRLDGLIDAAVEQNPDGDDQEGPRSD